MSQATTTPRASPSRGAAVLFLFFFLMGGGLLVPFGILPAWRAMRSRTWLSVPCQVVSSRVASHSDSDGTTYSIDILYEYEHGGRMHRSTRYDLMGGSSSGHAGKQAVVDRLPPGAWTTCHVDPDDPSMAVLVRGFTPMMLIGLVPLVFMLAGLFGMVAVLRRRGDAKARQGPWPATGTEAPSPHVFDPRSLDGGYRGERLEARPAAPPVEVDLTLKPQSPWRKAFGLLFAAAFWNGIVGVFIAVAISAWHRGRPEWFLMAFLIPFVMVGLLLLAGWLHAVLAALNPRPRLRLSGPLRPGAKVGLDWEFRGWAGRIGEMALFLEGWESALKQSGDSSSWQSACFCRLALARTDDPGQIRHGKATVTVPAEAMPAWTAAGSKVEWRFRCRGRMALWPDIDAEFPVDLTATPRGSKATAGTLSVVPGDLPSAKREAAASPPLEIELDGEGAAFAPGETATGRIRWRLPGAPHTLELRLAWMAGDEDTAKRDVEVVAVAALPMRARGTADFAVALPSGPPSCRGAHVRLHWLLEAVAARPDAVCARDFVMAPERREVRLEAVPDAAW